MKENNNGAIREIYKKVVNNALALMIFAMAGAGVYQQHHKGFDIKDPITKNKAIYMECSEYNDNFNEGPQRIIIEGSPLKNGKYALHMKIETGSGTDLKNVFVTGDPDSLPKYVNFDELSKAVNSFREGEEPSIYGVKCHKFSYQETSSKSKD